MRTRQLIGLLAVTPLMALAACGGDDSAAPATIPPPDATLPAPDDPATGFDHPTGADDVMLRIGFEGGFVTPEMTFTDLPLVLVTGDGRVFQQGPVMAVFPGPLLPNVQVRTISPEGIQELLALADAQGLLTEREYPRNDMIADAADTEVTIAVGDEVFTHRAYALGLGGGPDGGPDGGETDEARQALDEFVREVQALVSAPTNDVLGPEDAFVADTYLIRALPVGDGDAQYDEGIEPTVVEWPESVSVRLTDEVDCLEFPADEVRELFAASNQLTWFDEGGITYQVFVKPQLPGDSC